MEVWFLDANKRKTFAKFLKSNQIDGRGLKISTLFHVCVTTKAC